MTKCAGVGILEQDPGQGCNRRKGRGVRLKGGQKIILERKQGGPNNVLIRGNNHGIARISRIRIARYRPRFESK